MGHGFKEKLLELALMAIVFSEISCYATEILKSSVLTNGDWITIRGVNSHVGCSRFMIDLINPAMDTKDLAVKAYWYDPVSGRTEERTTDLDFTKEVQGIVHAVDEASLNPLSRAVYNIFAQSKKTGADIPTNSIFTVKTLSRQDDQCREKGSFDHLNLDKVVMTAPQRKKMLAKIALGVLVVGALAYAALELRKARLKARDSLGKKKAQDKELVRLLTEDAQDKNADPNKPITYDQYFRYQGGKLALERGKVEDFENRIVEEFQKTSQSQKK